MDHRCLYGHRVPAAFTFAIQSRSCPTCGAPTVTITGYQAARKLTTEVGLEAVAAFSAIRVLESEWVLTPVAPDGGAAATSAAAASAADASAAPHAEDEEVVVEDAAEPVVTAAPVVAAPEAREEQPAAPAPTSSPAEPIRATPRPVRSEPRIHQTTSADLVKEPNGHSAAEVPTAAGFDNSEEDFFQRT
ncbi:MAG: hypothetical protein Q8P18_16890 [Pseudomonadota bacterium]|nr:hypothetical protein [Pseudomonadota bacterium]